MEHRLSASGRVTVAIVDDHPLVREGLAARISAQPDMEVCGEAADIESALELIVTKRPSVAIVDIALRNGHGIDLIKRIVAAGVNTRMLVVSAYDESFFAERALRAGALGYINKQELQGQVVEALRTVLRGERYLSAAMAQRLIAQAIGSRVAHGGTETMTDRELQIFQLIGRGKSTREIAQELNVSVHTIDSHREHIRAKLDLHNGTELIQRAVQWHIENG
ncbi:MAG: two component transcriptional regulator, LuxR family [Gammaproteobacteria bacterium]|jgi:DNA-binding NarL/FixJ family response regulator|nr:two component transcriptional regulator, LuxR family [Gammaproteobacteria bacterium]